MLLPGDDDDVVEGAGTIFNQREDRPSTGKLGAREHLVASDRGGGPAASRDIGSERIGPDAGRAPIDEVRKRVGRQGALAPVAQHHRGGRAAAQRFGLRDVGNVEKGNRWRRLLRVRRAGGQEQDEQDAIWQPSLVNRDS